jgi:hypothetical protein
MPSVPSPMPVSNGLTRYLGFLWTRVESRKTQECLRCSREITTRSTLYRPIGEGKGIRRGDRLCVRCAENLQ